MKITISSTTTTATASITTSKVVTIRDDWGDNYGFAEEFASDGRKQLSVTIAPTKEVRAVAALAEILARAAIAPKDAIPADPATGQSAKLALIGAPAFAGRPARAAVEAVGPTESVKFLLWDADTFPRYDALNGGQGYGKSDLDRAIGGYLETITS